jgi:hypothetical protein
VDPELRDTLNQVAVDLRGEIPSGDAETREVLDRLGADLRGEIRTGVVEMRRYFDVVGESLRGDIRGVAEGMALLSPRTDGRFDEHTGRTGSPEGRVLRLEARVTVLEDDRKPRRPRRRR